MAEWVEEAPNFSCKDGGLWQPPNLWPVDPEKHLDKFNQNFPPKTTKKKSLPSCIMISRSIRSKTLSSQHRSLNAEGYLFLPLPYPQGFYTLWYKTLESKEYSTHGFSWLFLLAPRPGRLWIWLIVLWKICRGAQDHSSLILHLRNAQHCWMFGNVRETNVWNLPVVFVFLHLMDFFQDVPFSWIIEMLRSLTPFLWIIPLVTARFKRDSQIDGLRSQGPEIDFSHLICQYLMGLISGEQWKKECGTRCMYTTIVHYFSKILYSPRDAFSLSIESVSGLDLFWQVAKDTVDGRSPVKHQIEQYKLNSHLGGFTYLLCSARKNGEIDPIWRACFSGWNHQLI